MIPSCRWEFRPGTSWWVTTCHQIVIAFFSPEIICSQNAARKRHIELDNNSLNYIIDRLNLPIGKVERVLLFMKYGIWECGMKHKTISFTMKLTNLWKNPPSQRRFYASPVETPDKHKRLLWLVEAPLQWHIPTMDVELTFARDRANTQCFYYRNYFFTL